jgi:hypothetical protein
MRIRALPVELEAHIWTGDLERDIPAAWRDVEAFGVEEETGDLIVPTPQGPSNARVGDYVIEGTEGEFYPVPPSVVAAKYTVVGE